MSMFPTALALLIVFSMMAACESKSGGKQNQKNGGNAVGSPFPSGSPTNYPDNDNDEGEKDNEKDECESGANLLDTPYTYDDDIRSIVDAKCLSCHSGNTSPNLSSYSKLKNNKSAVLEALENDIMPPSDSSQLSSTQKSKFLDWLKNGMPEMASDSDNADDNDNNDENSSNDDCDTDSSDSDDGVDDTIKAWEELINPAKLLSCKGNNKIYDRQADRCHQASIATSYECNRGGIIAKFNANPKVNVETQLDQLESDGYEIDQCGEYNNDPIVYFYKKVETNDELKLQIKKLCKKGSAACSSQ